MTHATNEATRLLNTFKQPPINCWADAHDLYIQCSASIRSATDASMLIRHIRANGTADDIKRGDECGHILIRDIRLYQSKLEAIYKTHSDRVGGTDEPEELVEALVACEAYTGWNASWTDVVTPIVDELTAIARGTGNV